ITNLMGGKKLYINHTSIKDDCILHSVIDPSIYNGALQVTIACANFESTLQYHFWKKDVNFQILHKFNPYITPNVIIYYAEQEINSKIFNKNNPCIKNSVIS